MDHVQEHGYPELMRGLHKGLERIRTAIGVFHSVNISGVVPPTKISGKIINGHDFHGGDTQLLQESQPVCRIVKGAGIVWRIRIVKRCNVQFVHHRVAQTGSGEIIACPVEIGRVVDKTGAGGIDHPAGPGILFKNVRADSGIGDVVLVRRPVGRSGHIGGPITVSFRK